MRSELELIEKIEQYINGSLSAQDTAAFEQAMSADPELREAVALQRDLMKGVDRVAIRQQVQQAGKQYRFNKNLRRIGFGGAAMGIMVAAFLFFNPYHHQSGKVTTVLSAYSGTALPQLNEAGKPEWTAADSLIPAQVFTINAGADTVMETAGGIVLSIPAGAFVDDAGKGVTGAVSLCVKEALDPLTILSAGLSTTSGDRLLETGGMFFIDARQGGSILKINPAAGIYAQVPGATAKAGMQLFSGKRMPDGSIDWVNPVPVSHDLIPVDIKGLDFYPPQFLPLLHHEGYPVGDKRFTDSVYYSLAMLFSTDPVAESENVAREATDFDWGSDSTTARAITDTGYDYNQLCGINPAKIKTIWSTEYQNTLLATREFEARLKLIHTVNDPAILDLYVANLGRNLYEIDSMAARRSTGEAKQQFLQFASLRDGKVQQDSKRAEKLNAYYALKTKLLTAAIAKTEEAIRMKDAQAEAELRQKQGAHSMEAAGKIAKNFQQELEVNLESAYRQLGLQRPSLNARTINTSVVVTSTGWNNVDRYVIESTSSRTTLNYTDPASGKQAVIEYKPLSISIADAPSYTRLLAYLVPDKLSSFMNMNVVAGRAGEKLNGLMKYELVCIGFKGEQRFLLKVGQVQAKEYSNLKLVGLDAAAFANELNSLGAVGQRAELKNEVNYAVADMQLLAARDRRRKWVEMIKNITLNLFHCRTGGNWSKQLIQSQ